MESRKDAAAAEDPAALAPEMPSPPNPMVSPAAAGGAAPGGAPPYSILHSSYAYYYPYGYGYLRPPSDASAAPLPIPAQVSQTTDMQSAPSSSVPTTKAPAENQHASSTSERSKKSGDGKSTPSSMSENTASEEDGTSTLNEGNTAAESDAKLSVSGTSSLIATADSIDKQNTSSVAEDSKQSGYDGSAPSSTSEDTAIGKGAILVSGGDESQSSIDKESSTTLSATDAAPLKQCECLEEDLSEVKSIDGELLSDCHDYTEENLSEVNSIDGELLSDCQDDADSLPSPEEGNGPDRNIDAASVESTCKPGAAGAVSNVGGISTSNIDLESRNLDAAPIDICNSALSSRAVSPILTTANVSGTCAASKGRSPNVAARAADRKFPDDIDREEVVNTKPFSGPKIEDGIETTEPGDMLHLDEPKEYAWIRPRIVNGILEPGDPMMVPNGDGDIPQMYPASPCSYPTPSNEVWEGKCDTDWWVYIKWSIMRSKQWVPCDQCQNIFDDSDDERDSGTARPTSSLGRARRSHRSQRIRKKTVRFGSNSKADLKKLMQQSKHCSEAGSKDNPIKIDDACIESEYSSAQSVSPTIVSRAPNRAIGDRAARRSARVGHRADRLVDQKNEAPQHKSKCFGEKQDFGQPQSERISSASASSFGKRKDGYPIHGDECESYHQQLTDQWKDKKRRKLSCATSRKVAPSAVEANGTDYSAQNKAAGQSARIEELELHNQALLRELQRFQRLHGSEEPTSQPRRRLLLTRSSANASTAKSKQRQQPKRSATNDICTRRNLQLSVMVVNDDRQSDPKGAGVIARRNISAGEVFYDRNVKYCEGKPPLDIDEWRYISVGTGTTSCGYFRLVNTLTEMINRPMLNKGQVANIQWGTAWYEHESRRILRWKVIHDIAEGEELFAEYRSFE